MYISSVANSEPTTPEDAFGRRLRRLREKLGLTQADLAKLGRVRGVNLHPSAIAKIEARDVPAPRAIRLNEAAALAAALGRTVDELVQEQAALWDLASEAAHSANRLIVEGVQELGRLGELLQRVIDPEGGSVEIIDTRMDIKIALANITLFIEDLPELVAVLKAEVDGEHQEAP